MRLMSERLRALRYSKQLSQLKLANDFGTTQASMNRYEHNQSEPSYEMLLKYADYFNVSMDYLFGRTDDPQGCAVKKSTGLQIAPPEIESFVEMCFDPNSAVSSKLKEAMVRMLQEETK